MHWQQLLLIYTAELCQDWQPYLKHGARGVGVAPQFQGVASQFATPDDSISEGKKEKA